MEIALIKRAKKGDAGAYERLFAQYEADLYRMAYVYMKNREDAMDVVQETAYRSFKYVHTLKEPAYFKTWLIRILINSAHDVLKKRPEEVVVEPHLFVVEMDEHIDVKITLEAVMHYLTKEEKDVILLKYYEDYTFEQIADVLQLKLGTAKTILYRALKKLKLALQQEEGYDEQFKR